VFEPLSQYEWEKDIIWDTDKLENDGKNDEDSDEDSDIVFTSPMRLGPKEQEDRKLTKDKNPNQPAKLKISDIGLCFPGQSDNSVRKRLKECAHFKRGGDDSGSWILNADFNLPSDEAIREKTPPDDVCLYECLLAGSQRLQDSGITLHHTNPSLHSAVMSVDQGHPLRRPMKFIEEELLITPWNLTANFVTDADLRKLSLEHARLVLLEFGMTEEEIAALGRWDRIARVRELSSKAKATG